MKFWNFVKNIAKNDAGEDIESIELRIDGDIIDDDMAWLYEWFGIDNFTSPNAFRAALAEHKGKDITVWINSYGGDVFAGAGIYTALMEHKGNVNVKIEVAASAASVIAMAGTEINMSPVGIMMIHNPMGYVGWSESKDMRHAADVLDEVKETIMNAYQIKSGRSRKKIAQLMDDETWMSAKTALSNGFIDGILYTEKQENGEAIENSFGFSRLAIANKISDSAKRFTEQIRLKFPEPEPEPDETATPEPETTEEEAPQDEANQQVLDLYKKLYQDLERRADNELQRRTE